MVAESRAEASENRTIELGGNESFSNPAPKGPNKKAILSHNK